MKNMKKIISAIKPSKDTTYNILGIIFLVLVGSYLLPQNISKNEARSAFISNFSRMCETRVYLAERYYMNIRDKEKQDVVDVSWKDYMNSVIEWNSENLTTPLFIEYYFGKSVRSIFTEELLPKMLVLHNDLLEIRNQGKTNEDIQKDIENVKHFIFIFNEKLLGLDQ